MQVRYFALILGIVYLAVAVLGFIPGAVEDPTADDPEMDVDTGYGFLLGIFPVNILHTVVHLIVGVAGIAAYMNYRSSRLFAQATAVVFALLAIMGLIPDLDTVFGLIPLFGNDIWLHAGTALSAAYFGFLSPARAPERVTTTRTTERVDPTRETWR